MMDEEGSIPAPSSGATLFVVAGPNGSGKSTLTASGAFGDVPIIDPDAIAKNLNPDNPSSVALSAGKEALKQQAENLANHCSFVVETTLSGNGPLRLMETAQEQGFNVELHYIRVGTPEANIDRIASRVEDGGHDIPDEDVMRRYERSIENLPHAIAGCDHATLYDNSGEMVEKVAELSRESYEFVENAPRWAVQGAYEGAKLYFEEASTDQDYKDAVMRQGEAAVAAQAMSVEDLVEVETSLSDDPTPDLDDDYGL